MDSDIYCAIKRLGLQSIIYSLIIHTTNIYWVAIMSQMWV